MRNYIKIYDIKRLHELTSQEKDLLFELTKRAKLGSYSETNLVILNKELRTKIADSLELKNTLSLKHYLNSLIKKGVLKHEGVNTFRVNPFVIGRGREKNLDDMRKYFYENYKVDWDTGEIMEMRNE